MKKIWLENYQSGVVSEINPDAYPSLNELFIETCERFKQKTAYINLGTKLSYQALEEQSRHFASYLQNELQIKKGDRVGIMMPNLLQYPTAIFAILRVGAAVVNINPLYTPTELAAQVKDAQLDTLIVLANFASTVEQAIKTVPIKHIIVTQVGDMFPLAKRLLVNFVVKKIKKMVPNCSIPHAIAFKKMMQQGAKHSFQPVKLTGEDMAFLQYTGGTTGVAKGAVLSHRNMIANLEQASAWVKPVLTDGEELIVTALPLYHIFSLTANCLTFMKVGATNLLITNPRDLPNFIKEIAKVKFTAITGVNTLYNALLNHSEFKTIDFSRLKIAMAGGMALQESVAQKWLEQTGSPLLEAYGLTETSPAVTINPMNLSRHNGSIGLPISSTDIVIRDEQGNDLAVGEIGELCVKGPQVMREYWQKPEETKNVLSEDGWLKTGDITKIDKQGFIYLVDRKKDMILVSGFNVYPNEVESVISSHPGVLEVGVIGVNAEESGEKVKAFIVKKHADLTAASVISHCRKSLTAYKVPKEIEFCDSLPKTPVGKILRRALRELHT